MIVHTGRSPFSLQQHKPGIVIVSHSIQNQSVQLVVHLIIIKGRRMAHEVASTLSSSYTLIDSSLTVMRAELNKVDAMTLRIVLLRS